MAAESNVEKAALQVEEIIQAASLDGGEVARMMASLTQMLTAKDEMLRNIHFNVVKLQKGFNDSLETFTAKMKELGIPDAEIRSVGFSLEPLPVGATNAPSSGLISKS